MSCELNNDPARRRGVVTTAVWASILGMGCWMGEWQGLAPLDEARVGFLYVGTVGDHGWTYSHEQGRKYLQGQVEEVTTRFEEGVTQSSARAVIDRMVQEGDNVIVTTSYDFLRATLDAADAYPHVRFLHCSGFETGNNYGSYFARMDQALYLAGLVAGSMSRSGVVGYVGAVVIPETVRHVNAFTLGVREAKPDAAVLVEWVGSWYDVELETDHTRALIEAGADVIITGTDTTTPIEEAARWKAKDGGPVYSIGYDNPDSCAHVDAAIEENPDAAGTCLTSAYWNWGPMYASLVTAMLEGTWDPRQPLWAQMESTPETSPVALAELSPKVPYAVRALVDEKRAALTTPGEPNIRMPFVGPIRSSHGRLEVKEGGSLSDQELLEMCWFVEGVMTVEGAGAEVPPGCGGDYREPD